MADNGALAKAGLAATPDPPGLLSVLRLAISDPGSVLPRQEWHHGSLEPVTHWSARAAARAARPYLAKPPKHEPGVNCTCEPNDALNAGVCEYRLLADAVGDAFNPRDDEIAEVAILLDAVERAAQYIGFQDCDCTPEMVAGWEPCARCAALGQLDGKPVQR